MIRHINENTHDYPCNMFTRHTQCVLLFFPPLSLLAPLQHEMQDTLLLGSSSDRRRGRQPSAKRSVLEGRKHGMGWDKDKAGVIVHEQC